MRNDLRTFNVHINKHMRSLLVDWMITESTRFKWNDYTLHLAVAILDKFLLMDTSIKVTPKNLQNVGIGTMIIAANTMEEYHPVVEDYIFISRDAYTCDEIVDMHMNILYALNFDILCDTLMFEFEKNELNSHSAKVRQLLEYCLLDFHLMNNFSNKCIVESCVEYIHNNGTFSSLCLNEISILHAKYANTFVAIKHHNTDAVRDVGKMKLQKMFAKKKQCNKRARDTSAEDGL